MKKKILIIEDDVKISKLLETELKFENFDVEVSFDGRDGLSKATYQKFDLILLDLMLPKMSGIEVCKRVREKSNIPIIILTAKDEISDKVVGFDYGADDYLTKPFSIEELIARMRALFRRVQKVESKAEIFEFEDLKIDYIAREVYRNNVNIILTKREFELLDYLVKNKGIALSRDKILGEIWGFEYIGNDTILDLYIKYLRDKIDKNYDRKLIQTIRGVGFVFK